MEAFSDRLKEFIAGSTWIFAKTYAETWPHEYIVQERVDNDLFIQLAAHIGTHGYESEFYSTRQIYFDFNGDTYWHMGNIINRCPESETYRRRKAEGRLPEDKNMTATKKDRDERRRLLDSWTYEKTARTEIEYPVSTSAKTSERPLSEWTSSDFVRDICFQITGTHTFHAQENLEILRKFLNELIKDENKKFRRSAWCLGELIFESYDGIFKYDFQKKAEPNTTGFFLELVKFLGS